MPLGLREVLIVLRAKDQASRVISGVGQSFGALGAKGKMTAGQMMNLGTALTGVGIGIAGAGAAGLAFFNSAADAAMDYNKTAAQTLTQVDDLSISLDDVKQAGKDVAAVLPVAFEEIQPALYDIFSSMDVNLEQARNMLFAVSAAAVAGGVDVQTAGRSIIAIMNGFKLPFKDVTRVMDIQFQMVRKGVGTYDEFARGLGRAIPSANRAGQSVEELGAMMTFLTRAGLSVPMAATSAARALDAMAKPKVAERLQEMGIAVRDAKGEFRPLSDVLAEMNDRFGKMTAPERAKALDNLFKGQGGTIQARRFFDQVFKDFDTYEKRVDEMGDVQGAFAEGFVKQYDTEASKMKILENHYKLLKIAIGEQVLPIKIKLMEVISKLLGWFDGLSDSTQKWIIQILVIGSALAVVIGVALIFAGVIVTLIAALMFMGATLGTAIAIIAGFIAAIIAIPVAIYLVIQHSKTLQSIWNTVWGAIRDTAVSVWQDYLYPIFDALRVFFMETIPSAARTVSRAFVTAWNATSKAVTAAWKVIYKILAALVGWINDHVVPVIAAWADFMGAILMRVNQAFQLWWNYVSFIFNNVMSLIDFVMPYITQTISTALSIIGTIWDIAWNTAWNVINVVFGMIMNIVSVFATFIRAVWGPLFSFVKDYVVSVFNTIKSIIEGALKIIQGIFTMFSGLIRGDWGKMWDGVKMILQGAWQIINSLIQNAINFFKNIIKTGIDIVLNIFRDMPGAIIGFLKDSLTLLWQKGKDIVQGLLNGVLLIMANVYTWAINVPGTILGYFDDAIDWLWDVGVNILQGLLDGMKSMAETVGNWLGDTIEGFKDKATHPWELLSPSKFMKRAGVNVMKGFQIGLQDAVPGVEKTMAGVNARLQGMTPNFQMGAVSPAGGGYQPVTQITVAEGAVQLNVAGNLDRAALPEVQTMIDQAFKDLAKELGSR